MKKSGKEQTVDLLIQLMSNKDFCPSKTQSLVNEKLLLNLAKLNKVDYCLEHFLHCEQCQLRRSAQFLAKIRLLRQGRTIRSLLYQHEYRHFQDQKQKLQRQLSGKKAIAFKPYASSTSSLADLDVLVGRQDLPLFISHYQQEQYLVKRQGKKKEVQLRHPHSHFTLDLHFLLAYPHYQDLEPAEYQLIEQLSADVLEQQASATITPTISQELLLVVALSRYWYNDLLCGIKTPYELAALWKSKKQPNWQRLIALLRHYHFLDQGLFALALAARLNNSALPKTISHRLTPLSKLLTHAFSLYDLAIFPKIDRWYRKENQPWVKQHMHKYAFVKLVLTHQHNFLRLFRPRIILFLGCLKLKEWRFSFFNSTK